MPVTLTLEETKILYEKHIAKMPDDFPYDQALRRLVDKFGGPRVEEMALEINPYVRDITFTVRKTIKTKDEQSFIKRKRAERETLFSFGWRTV